MTLGEKMRQARLQAGLSQGQLCQGLVTRNMLSQIENGSARPSLSTLQALSARLGKNVQYFLDDATPADAPTRLDPARELFGQNKWQEALEVLLSLPESWEQAYLTALCQLQLGEEALSSGQSEAAKTHLLAAEAAGGKTPYYSPALSQYVQLLLAKLTACSLPEDDTLLLLRAESAIRGGDNDLAAKLLDCVQVPGSPGWHFVKGKLAAAAGQYATAAAHFRKGESYHPRAAWENLEVCARESGDYQTAYLYACKLRDL